MIDRRYLILARTTTWNLKQKIKQAIYTTNKCKWVNFPCCRIGSGLGYTLPVQTVLHQRWKSSPNLLGHFPESSSNCCSILNPEKSEDGKNQTKQRCSDTIITSRNMEGTLMRLDSNYSSLQGDLHRNVKWFDWLWSHWYENFSINLNSGFQRSYSGGLPYSPFTRRRSITMIERETQGVVRIVKSPIWPTLLTIFPMFTKDISNFMSEKFDTTSLYRASRGNNTYHTLHINQRDGFTQHHFVKWANEKGCKITQKFNWTVF